MDGKIALITGAGSGIGAASATAFAVAGATVLACDIDEAAAAATVEAIQKTGGSAHAFCVDVGDPAAVEVAVNFAVQELGGLDFAHNNAGISGGPGLLEDVDLKDWDEMIRINLSGVFYCMRFELRHMALKGRGAIVNTSSTAGIGGTPLMSAYTAAKHGVIGLTRTAAVDYATKGVRVNAICPGTTATPMLLDLIGSDMAMQWHMESTSPMNRLGTPDEIAAAAVFLCADGASYITGQVLAVDGGMSALVGGGSIAEA